MMIQCFWLRGKRERAASLFERFVASWGSNTRMQRLSWFKVWFNDVIVMMVVLGDQTGFA